MCDFVGFEYIVEGKCVGCIYGSFFCIDKDIYLGYNSDY